MMLKMLCKTRSSIGGLFLSSFERASTPVKHRQDWGRKFIILQPQTKSDTISDSIELIS